VREVPPVIAVALTATLAVTSSGPQSYIPWRMADWVMCMDGEQFYDRNPQFPTERPTDNPCAKHGGVRAYGPGKRLNER
jgi:hypothetical protein